MFPENPDELWEENEECMYENYSDDLLHEELSMFQLMRDMKVAGKNVMLINQQYYF